MMKTIERFYIDLSIRSIERPAEFTILYMADTRDMHILAEFYG